MNIYSLSVLIHCSEVSFLFPVEEQQNIARTTSSAKVLAASSRTSTTINVFQHSRRSMLTVRTRKICYEIHWQNQ